MKAFYALTVAAAALSSQGVAADEVRKLSFSAPLLGTWAETAEQCAKKDWSNVTIESTKYSDSSGGCALRWIVQSAGATGANYAAHSLCTSSSDPSQTETVNIIIRPQPDGRVMMGRSFDKLKTYQRCP